MQFKTEDQYSPEKPHNYNMSPTCFSQAAPSLDRIRKIPNGNYWSCILNTGA